METGLEERKRADKVRQLSSGGPGVRRRGSDPGSALFHSEGGHLGQGKSGMLQSTGLQSWTRQRDGATTISVTFC